jgi:hypothetical protein
VAALGEQEKPVKLVKEQGRRLVDRDEHRLAVVGELAEEAEDVERRLAVEARRRLVEEQQDRLGDELDDDHDPLALLDAEADIVLADQGVLDVGQLEQLSAAEGPVKDVLPEERTHKG